MTATRDIGWRLENWARVYRDTYKAGISPTGAFCEQLRREAEGDAPSPERRRVDDEDAALLERHMRDIETKHRMMLYWCYMRQVQPEVVCRKLSIAHRPATLFIERFHQAQRAIEFVLNNRAEMRA